MLQQHQQQISDTQSFLIQMPLIQPIAADNEASPAPSRSRHKESILQRFNRFHNANPHVYDAIINIAMNMKASGVKKFGMKGIFEYLRWQYSMQTQGDRYKLNNIFTALYSRMIMKNEPALKGFFETRARISENDQSQNTTTIIHTEGQ